MPSALSSAVKYTLTVSNCWATRPSPGPSVTTVVGDLVDAAVGQRDVGDVDDVFDLDDVADRRVGWHGRLLRAGRSVGEVGGDVELDLVALANAEQAVVPAGDVA